MNANSKIRSGKPEKKELSRNIADLKLFMLNLHRIISCGFKLRVIFEDLRQKYEGDYIYGRMFIAETIIHIIDTLDMAIFHLNALNGGENIELYSNLDNLKSRLNKCFEVDHDSKMAPPSPNQSTEKTDALSSLLGEIINYSARASESANSSGFAELEHVSTACDLINYCHNCLLEVLRNSYDSIVKDVGKIPIKPISIIGIPLSYLRHDEKIKFETGLPLDDSPDNPNSNPGALRFGEGIFEVLDSELYSPLLENPSGEIIIQGMMLFSNETLALYSTSKRFKFICTANICDAVGGNYISLLITSSHSNNASASSHELIRKLLAWLDFYSFSGYGFTTASIQGITRVEMESHLNTLGKLLSFVSATKIFPSDEGNVQQNLENFLEKIV